MKKFDRNIPYNLLPDLPPDIDFNDPKILKACIEANRLLGELKGYCQTLPDPKLLINTLVLQESKDSSAIENIVTTQDELYKAVISIDEDANKDSNAKEVLLYREALYMGMRMMKQRGLTTNTIVAIMQKLKNTDAGIRKNTGTKLANPVTREIIYTPPEGEFLLREKLKKLEEFINLDKRDIDPLVKMALVHYQFEAIHPFGDGNGRTGRILNVLFLVHKELLSLPVLYLSSFIIENKTEYYKLLQKVTENGSWLEWIIYMLKAVSETAALTLNKITQIQRLKEDTAIMIKDIMKYSYNSELVNLIFTYPYVKINSLEKNNIAKRQTASLYLKKLAKAEILIPHKMGKEIYYINHRLMNLLSN